MHTLGFRCSTQTGEKNAVRKSRVYQHLKLFFESIGQEMKPPLGHTSKKNSVAGGAT